MKKTECQRIDASELWSWRRLFRVSRATRVSNQSILKEINPEHSLEGWMLKLQYFGHLMQRANSLVKTLLLGKVEDKRGKGGDRRWDGWMASPTQWTWVWASSGRWWRAGKPGVLQSVASQTVGHDWATEQPPPLICHVSHLHSFFKLFVFSCAGSLWLCASFL